MEGKYKGKRSPSRLADYCWTLMRDSPKFDVQSARKESPIALQLYATFDLRRSTGKRQQLENPQLMKHFYCDFRVQHLNLHKNWHISFLLVGKSEIQCISVILSCPLSHVNMSDSNATLPRYRSTDSHQMADYVTILNDEIQRTATRWKITSLF